MSFTERPRHWGLTAFVTLSLLMALSVGQLENIKVGSPRYWLIIVATIAFLVSDAASIAQTSMHRAKMLLVFILIAGTWHLLAGDPRAVLPLGLLVLMLTWISTDRALLNVDDLTALYLVLIGFGIVLKFSTEINPYGLIPGQGLALFDSRRVSFFPNIAYTGLLSLSILMIVTKSRATAAAHVITLMITLYFLVFSFVRAALIAAVLYFALRWWFETYRTPRPARMFWTSICVPSATIIAIAFSAEILYHLQHVPLVSTLLLRGETNLTVDQIQYQQYRPWLWNEQLKIFATSPWLMGWGSFDFKLLLSAQMEDPTARLISEGSESLPTRLLTVYGIPSVLFTFYLIARLRDLAWKDDRWACACFPSLFLVMMNWGATLHPTDAMFVLLFLMVTRGSEGFASAQDTSTADQETARSRALGRIRGTRPPVATP